MIELELSAPRVTTWGEIWSHEIVSRHFLFEHTVTSEKYIQMLQNKIIPELEEHPNFHTKIIWQHNNGAPLHYGQHVRDYLDNTFAQWIGHRRTIEWSPRSLDITPCDFSLWEIMKDNVYTGKPRDVEHLKFLIKQEFTSLNGDIELCQSICRSVANRCEICVSTEGAQFEH